MRLALKKRVLGCVASLQATCAHRGVGLRVFFPFNKYLPPTALLIMIPEGKFLFIDLFIYFVVVGIELQTSGLLVKHYTTKQCPYLCSLKTAFLNMLLDTNRDPNPSFFFG